MSNNVCSQCGAPVTSDSRFCSHCGAKINDGVLRAEITIDDKARAKEVELEKYKFDAKGKLANRVESLGETYNRVTKARTEAYTEKAAHRKALAEEKVRKAQAKAEAKKAELEAKAKEAEIKAAEAKIKDARQNKILLIIWLTCIAVIVLYFVFNKLFQ